MRKGQEERSAPAPQRLRRASEFQWAIYSILKVARVLLSLCSNMLCALGQVTCPLGDSLCSSPYREGDSRRVSSQGVGPGICLLIKIPQDSLD